jgi:hypothetical protein
VYSELGLERQTRARSSRTKTGGNRAIAANTQDMPTKGQRNGCSVSPVNEMKLGREAVTQVSLTEKKRERKMHPALPWGEEKVRAHETNARTALARRVLPLVHLQGTNGFRPLQQGPTILGDRQCPLNRCSFP